MAITLILAALLTSQAISDYVDVDQSLFEKFGGGRQSISGTGSQFRDVTSINIDGKRKVKFVQYHNGIRVMNTGVVATEENGLLSEIAGSMLEISLKDDQSIVNSLSMVDPLEAAKKFYRDKLALPELDIEEGTTSVELIITDDGRGHARKVYEVSFFVQSPVPSRPFFHIDPTSGSVLDHWDGLDTNWQVANGTGPGGNTKTGRYTYGTKSTDLYKPFEIKKNPVTGRCRLESSVMMTVNLNHQTSGPNVPYEYDCGEENENTFKEMNGAFSPANDATYFGKVMYDMYQEWMGLAPLKFNLVIRVHYGTDYENAFWNGKEMTFGDGYSKFFPLVDLNVVTHEAAHGFTGQNSGLIYRGMSGGMNEAYSDIAGEAAEFYMKGKVDWMVGHDIIKKQGKALRYFDQPSRDGKSIDHAHSFYPNLNVHYSSGVYNRAFYLLAHSPGWDIKKCFKAFTLANKLYWTPASSFDAGACGVKKAAADYNYDIVQVGKAFTAVGVNVCGVATAAPPPPTKAPTTPPTTQTPTKPPPPSYGKSPDCTFDSVNRCEWVAPLNTWGNYWKLLKGETDSGDTGPENDANDNPNGFYVYMEGSSRYGPGPIGSEVLLMSKKYKSEPRCLSFAYHMWGKSMGGLKVDLVYADNAGVEHRTNIFTKAGDQGNKWHTFSTDQQIPQDSWIEMLASKGTNYYTDIAVDNIKVTKGQCQVQPTQPPTQPPATTSAPIPISGTCNFDANTDCGWMRLRNNRNTRFELNKGSTPSGDTGPSSDKSGNGYYVYYETSSPETTGSLVRMLSPYLDQDVCLTFSYHMYGFTIGSLKVSLVTGTRNTLLEIHRNQGNEWKTKSISVRSPGYGRQYQIEFTAVRGVSFEGDIALDDIILKAGKCP